MHRANRRSCSSLFQQRTPEQDPGIYWSIDYTPRSTGILQILRKHWHIINDIPGCERFPKVGYKRTHSLRDILTSSDCAPQTIASSNLSRGRYRCGSCSICQISTVCKEIVFSDLGFTHILNQIARAKSASTC